MTSAEAGAAYTIAAVSKRTGISCHALRVWERRYGFPVPRRSASGHRRYDAAQVEALLAISRQLGEGTGIAELAAQQRGGPADRPVTMEDPPAAGPVAAGSDLADLLIAGDLAGAEAAYGRLSEGLATAWVAERLIGPALVEVGERWFRKECAIYQEHQATVFRHRKLDGLLDRARQVNHRPLRLALVGTVQGDRHEGGALMLELAGWRAIGLGADLPVQEFQKAADSWRPDALARSFVLSRNINKRFQELARIRGVPVFVGGRSILNYQGLARRHGLIPLVGHASLCVGPMEAAVERRASGSATAS